MKRTLLIALAIGSIISSNFIYKNFNANADTKQLTTNCKSAYLIDSYSGECIYKENECKRVPIASVCKVMTLTLCFDEIKNGNLHLDDIITVSEHASSMGGSQVYLQTGLKYPLSELIKSIIVCSANDSCVAVSETVCGSEAEFVAKMNEKAKEIGCTDTLFANCTGLPKPTQYSCAKDVALMFNNLIKNEEYFSYSKIWMEDFSHPDDRTTSITNTNKLIRKYNYCDGGKTGFTNEAGFCLASTAVKDNLRLVSVVLGADTSKNRFDSAVSLFNYGFANYKNKMILDSTINLNDKISISGGKKELITVHPKRNCYVFSKKDEEVEISYNIISNKLKAPLRKDDEVGSIEIYKKGILYDTVELLSSETIEKATIFDHLGNIARKWTT